MFENPFGEEIRYFENIKRWVGTYAIVTGTSVGIGASICRHLVEARINVSTNSRIIN